MPVPTSNLTSLETGGPTGPDAKHPNSSQDEYIYVPDNFKVKEGARLTEHLRVGKPLGVGLQVVAEPHGLYKSFDIRLESRSTMQGGVFLLQDNDGKTDPNQVLKAVFKFGIGGLFGMTNLEREWRVGRQLALLTQPGEALPGFMGTGAGVVTKSGKFRGLSVLQDCIGASLKAVQAFAPGNMANDMCCTAAMILERIVGRDITKPIGKHEFHDVHYLRQMLYCTFKSLHQAQRKLAFHHADLRLANIMELVPETQQSLSSTSPNSTTAPRSRKMQDASQHDTHYVSGRLHPSEIGTTDLQQAARSSQQHPLSAGQPDLQADSATQTPNQVLQHNPSTVHDLAGYSSGEKAANFKMIDFGLADFREVFGAGYVTGKRTLIHNEPHHVQPLQHTDSKAEANGQAEQQGEVHDHHDGGPGGGHHHHLSLRGNKGIEKRADAVPGGSKSTKFFPTPSNLLPKVPPIERLYRYFWRRKGDVYALLWDMQRYIDGRVWPERDELEVRLMMDLIKHVTGVHVKAWFAPLDESDKSGNLALRDERSFSLCGAVYRNEGWAHWLRIRSLRIRSFLRPDNPGITAAEALTAPFFTYDQESGFFLDA